MSKLNASLKCNQCGTTSFHLPTQPKAEDILTCNSCGTQWLYDLVRREAIERARRGLLMLTRKRLGNGWG